jgi:CO/xanthine dehydrogenase Mo-binding subunit
MNINVELDAGAYAGLSSVVLQRTIFSATGAYNIENLDVRGAAYATNKVVSSAFRGFGGPQAIFAIEMHLENIALRLGIDPFEFKRAHLLKDGDLSATQGKYSNKIKLEEISSSVIEMSKYYEKKKNESYQDGKLHGIGFSVFFHGCGFTGAGEADLIKPKVKLKKYGNGEVEIFVSSAEIGQGVQTTLRKIVAKELDVPLDMVKHNYPDTRYCPDSGPTVASRTILIVGRMLQDCAREMKNRWDENEIEIIHSYKYPEELSWDNDNFIGNAYPEISWGANVIELAIDPVTFQVEIKDIWAVFDIGTPIDDQIVQGQIEGGITQGMGFALMEDFTIINGQPLQKSLTTYIIPSASDFPRPHVALIDNPRKNGPFGASGLGEVPILGTAPAVASALQNALGKYVRKVPVTPEYLRELMKNGN